MADNMIDISGIWPEWTLEKVIGRGSFGVVYRASREYRDIRTYSAIKVITIPQSEAELESLRYEGMTECDTRTYYRNMVDDLIDEVNLMVSLHDTPNIVNIYDFKVIEHEDKVCWNIFIRMELLTPLNIYLSEHTMSEEDTVRLGKNIASALEICESKKIIHRDIKPENIFVNEFGSFKLGDFGIARKLENMTFGMSQKGTFNYMAPEVVKSMFYDHTADIYSLGLVLYKLLNHGRLPFLDTEKQLLNPVDRKTATDRRLKGDRLPSPVDASDGVASVVLKACEYDPSQRYQSASKLLHALETYNNSNIPKTSSRAALHAAVRREKKPLGKPSVRTIGLMSVAGAILVALCIIMIYLAGRPGTVPVQDASYDASYRTGSSADSDTVTTNALEMDLFKRPTSVARVSDYLKNAISSNIAEGKYEAALNLLSAYQDTETGMELMGDIFYQYGMERVSGGAPESAGEYFLGCILNAPWANARYDAVTLSSSSTDRIPQYIEYFRLDDDNTRSTEFKITLLPSGEIDKFCLYYHTLTKSFRFYYDAYGRLVDLTED